MESKKVRVKSERKATGAKKGGSPRFKQMGDASSHIVKEAATLLNEELAAGIVAAKKMQQRFQKERSIDPADFKDALQRFQGDAHEVVTLLNDQLTELRTQENGELVTRLVSNTHDLVDLMVGFINLGAEVASQIAQANLPKKNAGK